VELIDTSRRLTAVSSGDRSRRPRSGDNARNPKNP
jgi:hypothetical protein